ncbi:uncharacterized protein LOC112557400 [Pomacea canaliculata]|uniref:uncharacterized protein LOC112557400 n=1 Tax=Pomacea canaliculata TaxID=400727 RepID=UPI000D72EEC0|nr:uncharacterized protein LOC112557400 [Pomacea canaliculata]
MAAAGFLTLGTALLLVTTPLHAQTESLNVHNEAKAVVTNVRDLVARTKEGSPLKTILQNILDLQRVVVNIIARLPSNQISECETQTVIKLAAAGIGSHEVLDVLLAEDDLGVVSARIGMALTFVNRVAQQLDDKLTRSSDVGPELTAIAFGINSTAVIINTAAETIKEKLILLRQGNRNRREATTHLAHGFDMTNHVVWWRDTTGFHTFHVGPFEPPVLPHGLKHLQRRSPNWSGNVGATGDFRSGTANGEVRYTSSNGRFTAGLNGNIGWGPGGPRPGGGFTIGFKF